MSLADVVSECRGRLWWVRHRPDSALLAADVFERCFLARLSNFAFLLVGNLNAKRNYTLCSAVYLGNTTIKVANWLPIFVGFEPIK